VTTSQASASRAVGPDRAQIVIIGGGHNGLTAAAYLAQAGRSVLLLEASDHLGGAAISAPAFEGVDARLSRYSYLVSLMPTAVRDELGLRLDLRSRAVASYTPVRRGGKDTGLLVERIAGAATAASFADLAGDDVDYRAWQDFYGRIERAAQVLAPTMLQRLPSRDEARHLVVQAAGEQTWNEIAEDPLGETLMATFVDDDVRGVVGTDGLIGTFASLFDSSLLANRCFAYHLIGDGTGEWKVPVGGMGAVSGALEQAAARAGVTLVTGARVTRVDADGRQAEVTWQDDDGEEHSVTTDWVLANVAPQILEQLRGRPAVAAGQGAQMKINMLLTRLPKLRSEVDPRVAFAGTFHIDESLESLESAFAHAVAGRVPAALPAEIYCHTLTDPSILGAELQQAGWHTMTLFGLHTPASLFDGLSDEQHAVLRQKLLDGYLDGMDAYLAEPIRECLATDAQDHPCIEAHTPRDLVATVGLPGGHIFHRDLRWPWAADDDGTPGAEDSVPGSWGVETDTANVLVCGAGARRGGGVSGIPGRAAAMKVLGY
jgi:phytoene dehydrogenase-like protein